MRLNLFRGPYSLDEFFVLLTPIVFSHACGQSRLHCRCTAVRARHAVFLSVFFVVGTLDALLRSVEDFAPGDHCALAHLFVLAQAIRIKVTAAKAAYLGALWQFFVLQ